MERRVELRHRLGQRDRALDSRGGVSGGDRTCTAVRERQADGLSGNVYCLTANRSGVEGAEGRGVNSAGPPVDHKPPFYLNPRWVRLEGHTNSRGDALYNLDLSTGRARAVPEFLMQEGVSPDRLVSDGHGESRPPVKGENEAARARDRRVDFFIEARDG